MNLSLSLKDSEAKKRGEWEAREKISRLLIKHHVVDLNVFCSGVYKSLHFRKKLNPNFEPITFFSIFCTGIFCKSHCKYII